MSNLKNFDHDEALEQFKMALQDDLDNRLDDAISEYTDETYENDLENEEDISPLNLFLEEASSKYADTFNGLSAAVAEAIEKYFAGRMKLDFEAFLIELKKKQKEKSDDC